MVWLSCTNLPTDSYHYVDVGSKQEKYQHKQWEIPSERQIVSHTVNHAHFWITEKGLAKQGFLKLWNFKYVSKIAGWEV